MKKSFLLLLLFFISCSKEQKPIENKLKEQKPMENKRSAIMQSLRLEAITTGNDGAYGNYIDFANQEHDYYDLLSLSLIMHHKYQNEKSYYQIYKAMVEVNSGVAYNRRHLEHLNDADRNLAVYYLTKGAQNNSIDCQATLEQIYRNGYGKKVETEKSDSIYRILENNKAIGDFYRSNRENKGNVDEIN